MAINLFMSTENRFPGLILQFPYIQAGRASGLKERRDERCGRCGKREDSYPRKGEPLARIFFSDLDIEYVCPTHAIMFANEEGDERLKMEDRKFPMHQTKPALYAKEKKDN